MNPIKKLTLWAYALSLSTLTFLACGDSSGKDPVVGTERGTAKVMLDLRFSEVPLMDSLVIDCIGADTLHLVKSPEERTLNLDLFPHDHWKFQAKIYANGSLMQRGEVESRLEAGQTTEISLKMHPLAGFIYLKIPLGFGNPSRIAYGQMELSSADSLFTYLMEMDDSEGIFRTELLPLETMYRLKITLYDTQDNNIYQVEDSLYLSPDNPVPSLELKSLRGKAKISIDNGSIDTLLLNGCTIGTGSAGSKAWEITAGEIAPGKTMVFGDTSASTPEKYRNTSTWGDLTNTKSTIVLQCNGEILDSLFYSNAQDSASVIPNYSNPNKNPQSTQLDIRHWETRNLGESWCLDSPTPEELHDCM